MFSNIDTPTGIFLLFALVLILFMLLVVKDYLVLKAKQDHEQTMAEKGLCQRIVVVTTRYAGSPDTIQIEKAWVPKDFSGQAAQDIQVSR